MYRQITIIGTLQAAAIVLGFIALGIHMKFMGYPEELVVRWTSLALFLREYGLFLLILPLLWLGFAIVSNQYDTGFFSFRPTMICGAVILFLLLCTFLYAAMHPFTRIMTIGLPPTSPQKTEQGAAANP